MNWRVGLVAAAALLIALTGVVHGLWTQRWRRDPALEQARLRLESASFDFGDWQSEELEIDAKKLQLAEIVGYRRCYYNGPDAEQSISLLALCGQAGPLSVHTPQHCYAGVGYVIVDKPQRYEITLSDGAKAVFWTARFYKPQSQGDPPLRIFWSWNDGNGWQASGFPRWTFRRSSYLFKLYVVREMNDVNEPLSDDPCLQLLQEALPRLRERLF